MKKENTQFLQTKLVRQPLGRPFEYKDFKGLKKENLRDHMNDLELIFTMLGEASTTKIARSKNM